MLRKIFGLISFISGILIIFFFPEIQDYQPEAIGVTGIIIGFGLVSIGIYLLKT